jgi:hypothetical protein
VSERGVKNFARAIVLAPRNGEMTGRAAIGAHHFGLLVQDEQIVNFRRVIFLELINLLQRNLPQFFQMCRGRIVRVLIQTFHV